MIPIPSPSSAPSPAGPASDTAPQEEAKLNLHVLMVEDKLEDYELIVKELKRNGLCISSTRVATEEALTAELQLGPTPDLVFANQTCGKLDSFRVLAHVRSACSDVPFILVTGVLSDPLMFKALIRGVDDWVCKHQLNDLLPAVLRAMRLVDERRQRWKAERERDWLQTELALARMAGMAAR